MPTTCKLIAKTTLTTTAADVTFSDIPGTYTDIAAVISARTNGNQAGATIKFNGATTNRSSRILYGNGINAGSFTDTSIFAFGIPYSTTTANTFGSISIYVPNYAGSTNKSVSIDGATENNATDVYMGATAALWSSTAAITSMTITPQNGSFVSGSSFYLYGITRADDNSPGTFGIQATGGDVTISGGYKYHVFKSSGTFNVTEPGWAEVLVVAGGGGSGGGGGGAGGFISRNQRIDQGLYNILIGAGGVGGTYSAPLNKVTSGTQGGNTSALGITSTGGGFGGGNVAPAVGGSGGSGGGAGYDTTSGAGLGISGQGNNGGVSNRVSFGASGGGGGAGAAGSNATSETIEIGRGGDGGIGLVWPSGSNTYYAGGGGGGANSNSSNATGGGTGGLGGGGNGARNVNGTGSPGTANTGGGGGGGETEGNGANGGSGIVIIRYPVS